MNLPRHFWIGTGALAFAFAVVAMVPPTKPIGGAKIDPNAHHGLAELPPPKPQPVIQPRAQTTPTKAVLEGYSGPAAVVASAADQRGPWRDSDDGQAQDVRPAAPAYRSQPFYRQPPPPQPRYAYSDPQPVSAEEDRAFRAGFRWARQRDLDDPRACREIENGPGVDGCLAFVRSVRNSYAGDEDDGPPPWWR